MGEDRPGDAARRRDAGDRLVGWLLMDADRRTVTGLLLAVFFLALVGLAAVAPRPLPASIAATDPVETLGQALVGAIVTGVTLVVTINQLVLSQELGAVDDQRDRMEGALAFRDDVDALIEEPVAPAEPAAFLGALVAAVRSRGEELLAATEGADDDLRGDVESYVGHLDRSAAAVADGLADSEFGTFGVVAAALGFDYSLWIHEGRRLDAAHDGALTVEGSDALDGLLRVLELFGPAREHIKTLYFQWELISLSRAILYAAVPALVVAAGMVLHLGAPGAVAGTTLGVHNVAWLVAAATTVALGPFALLVAYVLRIATVAKRTLAIGPFLLRETDRSDAVGADRE